MASQHHALTTYQQAKNSYHALSEPQNHNGCGGKEYLCHLRNCTLVSQITDCHFTQWAV